ncbi:hypothetical protein HN789_04735 [archaeon]|jgi:hypothetical protein|nr:hypothetical protein [archaeon]MBT4022423.1 hypothetical protein [archaeon]MBT4272577.1 hypothetical protein [archaeon]MBT4461256.1 hypothetical protein [archaeon]MBT4858552.1 hypothetical protein [archaeon]
MSLEKSKPAPTLRKIWNKYNLLEDEITWVKEETKFFDKILPVLSNKYFLKFLLLIFILIILIRFFAVFITIVFSLITSYIKFKRTKFGFPIEIEPTYLFSIVLMLAFGVQYGLFYILIPVTVPFLMAGPTAGTFVNIWNKLVVFFGVYFFQYFFPSSKFLVLVAVVLVLITDITGYFLRKKFGQPLPEILIAVFSNMFLRYVYFSFLLDIVVKLIYR